MFHLRRLPLALPAFILIFGLLLAQCAYSSQVIAAAPSVDRVEPPNWWAGAALNPVRILIHGQNLAGARVEGASGLTIGNIKVSSSGTYIFADVTISASAVPGARVLKIVTPGGAANAPFDISKPLPTAGRFQGFSPDDVVYLIMPDRFAEGDPRLHSPVAQGGLVGRDNPHLYHGGDFQGIIDHLPYLKQLGVTAIWINPIYQNNEHVYPGDSPSGDYHGYGAVNLYKVEDQFGSMSKLREMVSKAHALGIKVIQDQVANHVGQMHPWVHDLPTPTWFNGTPEKHLVNTFQVWTIIDPHATAPERKETLEGWFANILPDMNQNDPEVARYEIQNTLWWLGMTGFDGIREDTMPYVPRDFWTRWNTSINRQYPNVDSVGEVFDGDVALVSYFQGGKQEAGIDTKMRSLFDYPGYFPLRRAFAHGDSLHDLINDEARDWLFTDPNYLVTFLGNHDLNRFMSEDGATVQGLELAYTFLMTNRGIPLIYYGDEIGMTGGNDPDNRHDFPGGFPGDARNAFDAAQRTPQEQQIWQRLSTLTKLRAQLAPLRRGAQRNLYTADKQWVYARTLGSESVLVALNNDTKPATITFSVAGAGLVDGAMLTDRLGGIAPARVSGGAITVTIPSRTGAILAFQ